MASVDSSCSWSLASPQQPFNDSFLGKSPWLKLLLLALFFISWSDCCPSQWHSSWDLLVFPNPNFPCEPPFTVIHSHLMDTISSPKSSLLLTATFAQIHSVVSSHILCIMIFETSPDSPAHSHMLRCELQFLSKTRYKCLSLAVSGKEWKCILYRFWHQKTKTGDLQSFGLEENIMICDCERLSVSNTRYISCLSGSSVWNFFCFLSKIHMQSSYYCSVKFGICVPYHYEVQYYCKLFRQGLLWGSL